MDSVVVKVPLSREVHRRLRVRSAEVGRPMSVLVGEWVDRELGLPDASVKAGLSEEDLRSPLARLAQTHSGPSEPLSVEAIDEALSLVEQNDRIVLEARVAKKEAARAECKHNYSETTSFGAPRCSKCKAVKPA